jgi:DHA1 family multidrug resistance protein-like MFS transporter
MTSQLSTELPDADWKRALIIMFFAESIAMVGFSVMFPFLPLYVESLGATTGLSIELLAGLTYSAQAFTMAVASPFWGALADRSGRKLMVERSMYGGVVIMLLMAFVQSAEQLVFLRTVQGLVTGTIGAANALVAAAVPRRHTGYAMGLLQVGMGAGLAVGPLIGGAMADSIGYYAAFYLTSALLLVAGLLVTFGVKENFEPAPGAAGLAVGFVAEWRHILSAPGVVTTYSLRFMNQLGRNMLLPVAPLFVQVLVADSGRVNTFTGLVVGAASISATISAVYLGRLGDRTGHRRVLIVSALLAALFYLPQSLVTSGWQLLLLQALVGVCFGGIIPAISALLARYTQAGEEGAAYGLDNSITSVARAVAPLLGAGMALWWGLRATFVATAFIYLMAGGVAALTLESARTAQLASLQRVKRRLHGD